MTRQAVGETSIPIHWRPEILRGYKGGAAAAEGVENDVVLIAAGFDDSLKQRKRLLCRIARAILSRLVDTDERSMSSHTTSHRYAFAFRLGIASARNPVRRAE